MPLIRFSRDGGTVDRRMPNPKRSTRPAMPDGPPAPAQPRSSRRLVALALALGVAGAVMGAAALAFVLTRTDPGSCRAAAWGSLPAVNTLPAGWTATASGIYIDSVGTTLTGPTPSASDESPPAIFVSVGCYGADAHLGVTRSHDTSRSTGGTDIAFASVGDESFATHDATTGEYTVVVRRSQLVATLAAAGTISLDDLSRAAGGVDAARRAGTAGPAGGAAATAPGPSSAPAAPSASSSTAAAGSPAASGDVQHA